MINLLLKMEFELKIELNASPDVVYNAYLNSNEHTAMTGGEAKITPIVGAEFSAWDEYILGKNMELIPNQYIKQSWRTSDFPFLQHYSIVEINLQSLPNNRTLFKLKHSELEEKDIHYKQGWIEFYFEPMELYFNHRN